MRASRPQRVAEGSHVCTGGLPGIHCITGGAVAAKRSRQQSLAFQSLGYRKAHWSQVLGELVCVVCHSNLKADRYRQTLLTVNVFLDLG